MMEARSRFYEVGGKAVPQGMDGGVLDQPGAAGGVPRHVLDRFLTHVPAAAVAAGGVHRQVRRGEQVLPTPFLPGVGIFSGKSVG